MLCNRNVTISYQWYDFRHISHSCSISFQTPESRSVDFGEFMYVMNVLKCLCVDILHLFKAHVTRYLTFLWYFLTCSLGFIVFSRPAESGYHRYQRYRTENNLKNYCRITHRIWEESQKLRYQILSTDQWLKVQVTNDIWNCHEILINFELFCMEFLKWTRFGIFYSIYWICKDFPIKGNFRTPSTPRRKI